MSLNRTPHTFTSGETVTAAELNTEIRDLSNGIQSAWTSFVSGSVLGSISVGTGTLTARYQQIGKTIFGEIVFNAGSTTAYGGGNVTITVPVPPLNLSPQNQEIGSGYIFNGGTARRFFHLELSAAGSSTANLVLDSGGAVTPSSPFTMGPGTVIKAEFMYEAA